MSRASRRPNEDGKSLQTSNTANQSTNKHWQAPRHDPTSLSVTSFQNAQIGGDVTGRFYTAGGDIIVNDDNDLVSSILWPQVATGAMFDSAERQSAGRCHPGTRERMISRAMDWIMETDPAQTILWMYASAGAGKSSLMQSICELLRDSARERNGASFFFSSGDPDRGKATKLFVTLAYQLALQFPSVRAEINKALRRDPTLPTKSMAIQLRSLIVDPLLRCKDFPSPTPILFIDGLDECGADHDQRADMIQCEIINLISRSLMENNIHIRFMIASRPEYWISDSFEASPLSDITLRLSLRDDYAADWDIRRLLTERFEQIRSKKSRVMQSVALPWPPKHIVQQFVEEASGQYIYALTILKFVGDHPFKSPEEQLRIITTPGPHRATAYSELDKLYATIASAYPEWEYMKRVLGGLLIGVNLPAIQVFLEVPRTEITLVLDALRSLIDVVPPAPLSKDDQLLIPIFGSSFEDEKISFCHLSFREFLLDEARSGSYHIDVEAVRSKIVCAFVGIIQRNLDENYKCEPHISCNVSLLEYRRMMDTIIREVAGDSYSIEDLFLMLHGMTETFHHLDSNRHMNHPACFMRDMDLLSDCLEKFMHKLKWRPFPPILSKHDPSLTITRDSSKAVVSQLQNLASIARKSGIRLLSLRKGCIITQTLFLLRYMAPLTLDSDGIAKAYLGVKIHDLLKIPGSTVDDTLSSIMRHRHIINVKFKEHLFMSLVKLGDTSVLARLERSYLADSGACWPDLTSFNADLRVEQNVGEGWLCYTEWTNRCTSLVSEWLRYIMNNLYSDWEDLCVYDEGVWQNHSILAGFFDNHNVSDIRGEDYFSNKYCLSLLEVMVDLNTWMAHSRSRPNLRPELGTVIIPVLRWFNRQLANPKTAKLIEDHDASLRSKMTTTMNAIFQKCFVPMFTTPYFSRLIVISESESLEIMISSSSYSEAKIGPFPHDHNDLHGVRTLHNEIFVTGPRVSGNQPVIPSSEWYPYFAAYLLNICVKNQYFQPNPRTFEFSEFFPFIVQCLPYAQTTPRNLDALRAIKHLSKKFPGGSKPLIRHGRTMMWGGFHPPAGFCSCASEFLKRYEPDALSSEELSEFMLWMRSITEVSLKDWRDSL